MELGYKKSTIDSCLYYKNGLIRIIYTDDCIMAVESLAHLEEAVIYLANKLEILDKCKVDEHLELQV
jgi:hypothetical protein